MIKRTNIQMLTDFISGLNDAIDATSQMVHHRINPKFMGIRDMLNIIRDKAKKMLEENIR